jgi:processive 1,2-diacylglycerol beta-glucosyltransferase
MPQERLTEKYFQRAGAAELVQNAAQFRALVDRWAADPGAYEQLRNKFLQLRYEEDPTLLIEESVGLAQDAAGVKLARLPFVVPNGYNQAG